MHVLVEAHFVEAGFGVIEEQVKLEVLAFSQFRVRRDGRDDKTDDGGSAIALAGLHGGAACGEGSASASWRWRRRASLQAGAKRS